MYISRNSGFHLRLKKIQERQSPRNIMSELGWNVSLFLKAVSDIIKDLNNVIMEHLGEKIEIKVLRSGIVTIFDYHYEIDVQTVSDSIFRILYYLIALRTSINYTKIYGLERKFIIMLEEPEAHIFPFLINTLVDHIARAIELAYVVITTHNPILISALWDRVKEVKTYYVHRDEEGSTRIRQIDVKRLAEEMNTVEELLLMSPREILSKFTVHEETGEIMK